MHASTSSSCGYTPRLVPLQARAQAVCRAWRAWLSGALPYHGFCKLFPFGPRPPELPPAWVAAARPSLSDVECWLANGDTGAQGESGVLAALLSLQPQVSTSAAQQLSACLPLSLSLVQPLAVPRAAAPPQAPRLLS